MLDESIQVHHCCGFCLFVFSHELFYKQTVWENSLVALGSHLAAPQAFSKLLVFSQLPIHVCLDEANTWKHVIYFFSTGYFNFTILIVLIAKILIFNLPELKVFVTLGVHLMLFCQDF